MVEDFPSRASRHQRTTDSSNMEQSSEIATEIPVLVSDVTKEDSAEISPSRQNGKKKSRRIWPIVLAILIVVALGVGAGWYFINKTPANGIPSSVPLPATTEVEQLIDTGQIVTFAVTVGSVDEMDAILKDFQDSWDAAGEPNIISDTERIYAFSKDGVNATIKLETIDGVNQVSYALSGTGVGSGDVPVTE